MPTKKTAQIIPFPAKSKQQVQPEPNALEEMFLALSAAPQAASEAQSASVPVPVVINGNGAQVTMGSGSINNHNHAYHVEKISPPVVHVQTGVGVIDARQKRRLLELRDSLVEASAAGKTPKTPGGVMLALNRYMKVNKYDEILAVDFEKAEKWLVRQRAIKASLPSARKKLPSWRDGRMRAVHARCKERGFESWRLDYMKKKFDKVSMVDLSDDDLETLYRAVMAKK